MKAKDWEPRRRVKISSAAIVPTTQRDRVNGWTTDTPPTDDLTPKIELQLDSGHLVTIVANRVRYVTDCV